MASITIAATDGSGSFSAYVQAPKTTPTGVVVLIQEIFGVNQAMRDTAAWVADMGFIAVCPDLFWRIEPGIDITDKTDAEWKRAFELFQAFDQAKREVKSFWFPTWLAQPAAMVPGSRVLDAPAAEIGVEETLTRRSRPCRPIRSTSTPSTA